MKDWYNQNNCEQLLAYHAYYPVAEAAMLWCGVPASEVQEELSRISPHITARGVFTHPYIPCFEIRCRVIQDAISNCALPASRENGKVTDTHIAPERRHVSREHLKAWIAKEHPADKPAFLFDEIERNTHSAISADAFRALQAERDALKARIEKATDAYRSLKAERDAIERERASLAEMVEMAAAPNARAETTYLNIIGGLLGLMLGKSPAGKSQSVFENQTAVVSSLLAHYSSKPGMGRTTLEQKFAEAKRSINAT